MEIVKSHIDSQCDECDDAADLCLGHKGETAEVCFDCGSDMVDRYHDVWMDDVTGDVDGWVATTHSLADVPGQIVYSIRAHDAIVIGPDTDDVDRTDLPSADEVRQIARDKLGDDAIITVRSDQ